MPNPTLDPATFSKEIVQETIRPGIKSYLDTNFSDPEDAQRETSISNEPGDWPPLVVTALPEGGRVLYPHVVVSEENVSGGPLDARTDFGQHDMTVGVEVHGTTTTQMYNLRGLVRGWFLENIDTLRDAGFAIETPEDISGNAASWDPTSKTVSWEVSATGLVHTHPDA